MTDNDSQYQDRVQKIPIEQLQPNPLQPRGIITAESVQDLVDSIKTHGVLEPLVVAHTPAGYQIIVGERRWRASKIAGEKEVPCIIKETSPRGMLEMALVENVQREDLNPIERAKAFERLAEEFSLSNIEIARRIGKSAPYVSNTLRLLELPDALKDGLLSGLISEGHARALQAIKSDQLMIEAYKLVLKESASVRRAEEIARRMRKATGDDAPVASPKSEAGANKFIMSEEIDKMEDKMREALGKKSDIKLRRSLRKTKIYIALEGKPKETEETLQKLYKAILAINPASERGQ